MKNKNKITTFIFIAFLAYISSVFYYFQHSNIDDFDKNHLLLNKDFNIFEKELKEKLNQKNLSNLIIHIRDNDCKCNLYSNEHLKVLNKKFNKEKYNVETLTINDLELKEIIPAYPSIIMFNEKSELTYFGAYSDGLMCSTENSIVDMIFSNMEKGFNPKYIGKDTKGCYCYS